jgi:hypothetical protein
VADALVTNFFYCFVVSKELHSDQGRNFDSRLMIKVLERLEIRPEETPTPTAKWHSGVLYEDGGGALEESGFHTPEGLR